MAKQHQLSQVKQKLEHTVIKTDLVSLFFLDNTYIHISLLLGYCFYFITIVFILFNSFECCLFKCTRNRCLSRGRLRLTLYVYVYHNSNFQLELRKYPTCFVCLICFRIKTLRASLPKRTRSRQKMSAKVFRSFIVAGGDKDLFSGNETWNLEWNYFDDLF